MYTNVYMRHVYILAGCIHITNMYTGANMYTLAGATMYVYKCIHLYTYILAPADAGATTHTQCM